MGQLFLLLFFPWMLLLDRSKEAFSFFWQSPSLYCILYKFCTILAHSNARQTSRISATTDSGSSWFLGGSFRHYHAPPESALLAFPRNNHLPELNLSICLPPLLTQNAILHFETVPVMPESLGCRTHQYYLFPSWSVLVCFHPPNHWADIWILYLSLSQLSIINILSNLSSCKFQLVSSCYNVGNPFQH